MGVFQELTVESASAMSRGLQSGRDAGTGNDDLEMQVAKPENVFDKECEEIRHRHSQPDRGDVSLRQPRLRPPGSDG